MSAIASRYARAFADVIFGSKLDAAQAQQQIQGLGELIAGNTELRTVLQNPAVAPPQKIKVLDALAARMGVLRQVRNFAAILTDKRRIALLPEIAALLQTEINERLGFADAEVTTARELSGEERIALEGRFAGVMGKQIRATYQRDPQVLGGVIVKVGSTVYDGSVRGRLQRLRNIIAE